MYRQHFGLRCAPLSKEHSELWDDGALAQFNERFQWLLHSPGIGLLTGASPVWARLPRYATQHWP
jgi:MSHA biogenesis protein MshM